MLIHQFLIRSAQASPDAIALIDQSGAVTSYEALDRRANRMAHLLQEVGVRAGDRVVLGLENSVDWAVGYFGILKAGAVAVPVPPGARSDRLPCVLRDCGPRACIVDPQTASSAAASLEEWLPAPASILVASGRLLSKTGGALALSAVDLDPALDAMPDTDPTVRRIDLDLAAIVYTSGSTGAPRGVMLTHLNIRSNTESIVQYLGLSAADRMMVVLPFHYVYGLSLLHTHVCAGGSLVIDNRFAFPNAVLRAMQAYDVTGLAGVPSTFALLLHRSALRTMTFESLRYVTQAGGAMPQALVREWRAVMPRVPLYMMYGATEASARLSYLEPAELDRRPGSIGRAIPNVELVVVGEDGSLARPGEVGELVARGANIMTGYWNRPEETAAAFGPHGYRTGDLAVTDEDGYLYLVGRRQDFLKVGGHRVGAREIEEIVYEHPAVEEAAVLGAPHHLLGEAPVLFVVRRLDRGVDSNELLVFCRERLPEYKVPVKVVILDELPRTDAGKIDKLSLRNAVTVVVATPTPASAGGRGLPHPGR